jgi:AcrR family transcriptional regulator
MKPVKTRAYRSTIRRGDAPRLVCEAAHRLFTTKGYVATSIEDIATEAGVARPTVFSAVGSKAAILKAVVDHAMTGDAQALAVADRPWFTDALQEPDAVRATRLHVRNIADIVQRVAPLLRVLETAATVDADAAALWTEVRRQRRAGTATIAADIAGKATLHCDERLLADMLFALPPDLYVRLVQEEGWPFAKFESWLGDVIERVCIGNERFREKAIPGGKRPSPK